MTSLAASGIERIDRAQPLPLSFAQQRLWFLDRWDPEGVAYNVPWAVRLRGDLDVTALTSAIAGLVERHQVLRTVYVCPDGVPAQIIQQPRPADLQRIDLSDLPGEEREAALGSRLEAEARRRFDLASDLAIRAALFRLSAHEHVLLLTVHHIACDGWSLGILARELGRLYEAALQARDAALPALPIQYADYAAWQRAAPEDDRSAAHLDYWSARLKEELAPLELPIAGPRPPVQTSHGSRYRFALRPPLVERVKALARSERATLYMALAAGFTALLHRYSGQRDLTIGSPIAGRTRPEIEGLIGCFVNTLVIRSSAGGESTFRDLLQHVREEAFGAYQHQDIPFERLVEAFRPARDASRTPFFQVMLALQNVPAEQLSMPGLSVEAVEVDTRTSKFDSSLYFTERQGALEGYVEWNTDLFEREAIARLVLHFETLLDAAVGSADRPLAALPVMDAAERQRTLVDWNATSAPYPDRATIHELFAAQAARTPDGVAFEAGPERLTFAELDRQSSRLAAGLRAAGLGPGGRAGIAIERSFTQVIAVMAVLKTGAAYVPLDPSYPRERLAFMVQDSGVAVLLSEDRHRGRFPEFRGRFVALDQDWPATAPTDADQAPAAISSDDPAYVIYTSGLTGTPKGVVAPHRGAVNRMHWMWRTFPFEPGEVSCQKTSLNFVDAVWELFGPLLQGVPAVIIPDDVLKDPARLLEVLAARRVTRIGLVPSLLDAMLSAAGGDAPLLPDLRYCVTSGEALAVALAKRFNERLPHATLLNLYGLSEVAADVTCSPIRDAASLTSVTIRSPHRQLERLSAGCRWPARAGGSAGRGVRRRRWPGARLPAPSRPDGRALCPESVRRPSGRTPVPHRRHRTPPDGRPDRVRGPH